MIDHLSPDLIINGLRLLLEGYKVARDKFKDKKTPERVEEILTRAEKAPPKTLDAAELGRSISDALEPGDAAIVIGDLELLSLLTLPAPALDAFDYWGKLEKLANGLQIYAKKNRLFELRGKQTDFSEGLALPKTGACILPKKHAERLPTPYTGEDLKEAKGFALLRKDGKGFPIVGGVGAHFYQHSGISGLPGLVGDRCFYEIGPGQQRHWLRFRCTEQYSSHFAASIEYMLEASDFISIVQALRDDIRDYATALQADEQKIATLFAAIDAFAQGVSC